MAAGGCVITRKPSALQWRVVGVFWCCLGSSEVLLWDVVHSCSSRVCACVFVCVCVCVCVCAKPHDPRAWFCLGWRLELDRKTRGVVVVVEVDPRGLWNLTSALPPMPPAATHTQIYTHTRLDGYARTHSQKVKYRAHVHVGRFNKCINKAGHTAEKTREGKKKKYTTSQIKQTLKKTIWIWRKRRGKDWVGDYMLLYEGVASAAKFMFRGNYGDIVHSHVCCKEIYVKGLKQAAEPRGRQQHVHMIMFNVYTALMWRHCSIVVFL